jgi:hypothetical protein
VRKGVERDEVVLGEFHAKSSWMKKRNNYDNNGLDKYNA